MTIVFSDVRLGVERIVKYRSRDMEAREVEKNLEIMRDIVVAYVSKNHIPTDKLDSFIFNIYSSLIKIQISSAAKN